VRADCGNYNITTLYRTEIYEEQKEREKEKEKKEEGKIEK